MMPKLPQLEKYGPITFQKSCEALSSFFNKTSETWLPVILYTYLELCLRAEKGIRKNYMDVASKRLIEKLGSIKYCSSTYCKICGPY